MSAPKTQREEGRGRERGLMMKAGIQRKDFNHSQTVNNGNSWYNSMQCPKIDFNFTAIPNGDEISEEHDLFQFIFPLQTHTYLHFASHYHADNVICIMQRHLENWSIESHGTAKWVRLHGNWLMCAHRRRRGFALPANLISLASESPNWMVLWLLHMLNDENSCSHLLQQHCW